MCAEDRLKWGTDMLFVLCRPPFDATNQLALAKKINAGKFTRIPSQYSEGLFQVIRWMLHRQVSCRWTGETSLTAKHS